MKGRKERRKKERVRDKKRKLHLKKTYLETNKNGNTTYQNLKDKIEIALRGKFIE